MKKASGILFFVMFFFLAVTWEAEVEAQSSEGDTLLEGVLESLGEGGGGEASEEGDLLDGIFESMEKAEAEAEAKKRQEKAEAEAKKRQEKAEAEAKKRQEKAERRERERRRAAEKRESEEQNRRMWANTINRAFEAAEQLGDEYVESKRIEIETRRAIAAENARRRAAAEAETRRLQAEADAAAERRRRAAAEAAERRRRAAAEATERGRRRTEEARREAARSSSSTTSRGGYESEGDGSSGNSEDSQLIDILDQALSSGDSGEGSGDSRAEEARREAEREKARIAKAEVKAAAEKAAREKAELKKAERIRKEKEARAREEAKAAEKERIRREKEKKIPFYSAVAGSFDKGSGSPVYGYATGHRSDKEARETALEKCRKAGGDNCGVTANLLEYIHNGCVALAYWPGRKEKEGRSNVEAGVGVSLRQAEASAINACRIWNWSSKRGECRVAFSKCYCMRSGCEPRMSHNGSIYVPQCFREGENCKE